MIRKYLKRIISLCIVATSVLVLNPIGANAKWKVYVDQNDLKHHEFWYQEGDSYAIGWRKIDGVWYYFDKDGWMVHDKVVDGWYLNKLGIGLECIESDGFVIYKATGTILRFNREDAFMDPEQNDGISLVIPREIDGIEIRGIGLNAFDGCVNIKSITLPDSIVAIVCGEFDDCTNTTFYVKNETIKQMLINTGVGATQIKVKA